MDEQTKYRLKEAEKLIQAIQKVNNLGDMFLPTFAKKLNDWIKDYYNFLEYYYVQDKRAEALKVIQELNTEFELQIKRNLEAYRILLQVIEELDKDLDIVKRIANNKIDERDYLKELITKLEKLLEPKIEVKPAEVTKKKEVDFANNIE